MNSTDADRDIRTVLERLYSAWADYDADAFAELYTEDATVVMPGVFNDGREEIRAYMAAAFDGPLKGSRPLDEPRRIRFPLPGTAVVISEAGILLAGEDEVPADRLRRATWVLVRDPAAGTWAITSYHNAAV
ncbi:SgcJ/EcaC family oxidoreductase [Streptomyces sp. NPDC054766]|uniref:SgcJ/EcaC family oxidoreductase n=1 Tax=Streptomyces rhizosphaerihabitans TaxID=1266770 RepID=UPI0021BE3626|nr:SgcJ/EcaC family oxidoreductase [Streptomyces rhizosphaerihabitans]MCT9010623.1 SgcJ/EcaC family oxidoreductase [Streptomyces rhizosphaerihabitans]